MTSSTNAHIRASVKSQQKPILLSLHKHPATKLTPLSIYLTTKGIHNQDKGHGGYDDAYTKGSDWEPACTLIIAMSWNQSITVDLNVQQ